MGKQKATRIVTPFLVVLVCPLLAGAADPDLVGWWRFDSDGLDASGNGRDGTLEGDAHFVVGYSGQALALDGAGDYFTVNDYKGLMSTEAVTVTAWVQTTGNGTIAYWGRNAGRRRVDFRVSSGRLRVEHGSGNLQGDTSLNDGQWHHVALTIPAGAPVSYPEVKLYLDGRDDTRATRDPEEDVFELVDDAANVDLTFGRRVVQDDRHFPGLIDGVRMYSRVLTVTEIRDLMHLGYLASAHSPDPPNGSSYEEEWARLEWIPGPLAASHNLYFGTSFEDVNTAAAAAFVGNVTEASQMVGFEGQPAPEGLLSGTTYYWRIDEVNEAHPDSPWPGQVWSFWIPSVTAYDPSPPNGRLFVDTSAVLTWNPGLGAIFGTVYFGTDANEVANATGGPPQIETTYDPGTLDPDTTYYWRVDTFNGVQSIPGPVWSFRTMPEIPPPTDPNLIAWWTFDEGTGPSAVDWSGGGNRGTLFGPQWATAGFYGAALDFDVAGGPYVAIDNLQYSATDIPETTVCAWIQTANSGDQYIVSFDRDNYYRLEVNGSGGTAGQVGWDVMTSTGQVDHGSVTRVDNGRWHHVCGVFDNGVLTIYIDGQPEPSAVGGTVMGSGNTRFGFIGANSEATTFNGARGAGNPVTGLVDDVRIYDRALTQGEIETVMRRPDPLLAGKPNPAHWSTPDVEHATTLAWLPGDPAIQHDVYFGMDPNAVAEADVTDTSGIYRGRQDANSYDAFADVEMGGGPYYWRVDEIEADGTTLHKGWVWTFTVLDHLVIDDFENYTDEVGQRIFQFWIDGFGYTEPEIVAGNGTGSTVGNFSAPFAERGIVQGGIQSMPLAYDNSVEPFYSEAEFTFPAPQDWTRQDVKALTLSFYGDPCNVIEPLYVGIEDTGGRTAVVNYEPAHALRSAVWHEWNIDLRAFGGGVNLAAIRKMFVGVGDRIAPQAGGTGTLFIDSIGLYRPRCVPLLLRPDADSSGNCVVDRADLALLWDNWLTANYEVTPVAPSDANLVAHYRLDGNTNDSSGNGYHGDPNGFPTYVPGVDGQAIHLDGIQDYVAIQDFNYVSTGLEEVSVCAWMRTQNAGSQVIASFDRNQFWRLGINQEIAEAGQVGWHVMSSEGQMDYGGASRVDDGQWHHVAGVFDNGILTIYVDGNREEMAVGGPTYGTNIVRFGYIGVGSESTEFDGTKGPFEYFDGDLDDVRMYSRALSQAEVASLAGKTKPFAQPLYLLLTPREPAINIYDDHIINFNDFALVADTWLDELLWPQP